MIKRLAAIFAALALVLLVAAPAAAVEINQTLPIDSTQFGVDTSGDCHGTPTGNQLDWHFILNQSATDDQTLTVSFQSGFTTTVSNDQLEDHYVLHFDVYTDGNDVLDDAFTSGDTGQLVLSAVCGNPTPPVPEAPASALLLLTGGLVALGFVAWRMRQNAAAA